MLLKHSSSKTIPKIFPDKKASEWFFYIFPFLHDWMPKAIFVNTIEMEFQQILISRFVEKA